MATVNTDNYTIGQIDLYFAPVVAHASLLNASAYTATGLPIGTPTLVGSPFRTAARNLGNIVTSEINPEVTYAEHFISVFGARRKDKVAAITKTLMIPFTFDEINENNLKRFFLASSLGGNKLAMLEKALVEGSVSMVFRTDIGTDFVMSIPKAIIRPDGNLAVNPEDWWTAPMVLEVLYYDTGQYATKPYGVLDLSP